MEKFNKFLTVAAFCLLFMALAPAAAHAEEYASEKNGLDVVFVMDYSGSMKSNDSEHIAQAMVKAFIDTVHSADIRIGFVSYNDQILSSTSPVSAGTAEEREKLKQLIDGAAYSGNTDMGLGLRYACGLLGQENGRKRLIVLISDGESDLEGSKTGRTLQDSEADAAYALDQCGQQEIPIDTIAFGDYDGNTQELARLSQQTGGQAYTVNSPENLIEILYGIFTTNMDYSIQEITSGIYAQGLQNIRIQLEDAYLDELDVLMISSQTIGGVNVLYGDRQIEPVNSNYYAVAKITDVDSRIQEMTVQAETKKNQELKIYLVSYRDLTPILKIPVSVYKNAPIEYEIFFKDKNGSAVSDGAFYGNFTCALSLTKDGEQDIQERAIEPSIRDGMIGGEITLGQSGVYRITAKLDDSMGDCTFGPVSVSVINRQPEGSLPDQTALTVFGGEKSYLLDDYFNDPDGDPLTYRLSGNSGPYVKAVISDGILTIKAEKAGKQTVSLAVSDGEEETTYFWTVAVAPLWRTYWWAIVIICAALAILLWKLFHKPKPELEVITEQKKQNRFAGRLDVYFTALPEGREEIPPLTFPMYRLKESRVSLGDLMREYPEASDSLELEKVFLIADDERRMVLYHSSGATIMLGSSIACRQLQYSLSFGDVVYITSQDGLYELEIHYIAMIQ